MNKTGFTLYTLDYPPNRGGIASYLYGLVRASEGGILVHSSVEKWYWRLWPTWLPIVRKMRGDRRTILVSHVFPLGTAAWLSRLLGGPEYGVIFHGLDLRNAKGRWKRWLLRRICASAKILIVNSESTKRDLETKISRRDAIVLYPALSRRSGDVTRAVRFARRPTSSDPQPELPVILSIARLVPRKGIDVAIRALKKMVTGPAIRYVVIGDGPDRERLEAIAKEEGVAVEFVGAVTEKEKNEWLERADLFLLPVRDEGDDVEGFGIVFLEAAAAGVPSIAGRSGGAAEAVKDGETGILVDPENVQEIRCAVLESFHDREKIHTMGEAGKEWAKQFSWERNWEILAASVGARSPRPYVKCTKDVSVIIPCFNHAYILRRTLEGILAQSLQPKEVIIVDDGSSDHPERVVGALRDWLPIRFVRLDENKGAPFARNTGAKMANGDFLLFLDADAELAPNALQTLSDGLRNDPGADFAYGNFLWGGKRFRSRAFDPDFLKKRNFIHTSSLLRRSAFPGFDETLKKFQDWDLWLTMASRGRRGVWIDEILYRIEPRGKEGMSRWLPRIMHRIPWDRIGFVPHEIAKYRDAERIVKSKHGLL